MEAVGLRRVRVAAAVASVAIARQRVSGRALWPHYSKDSGFATFQPLPPHPTPADFRRARVRLSVPRRLPHLAERLALVGLGVISVGVAERRFRQQRPPEDGAR